MPGWFAESGPRETRAVIRPGTRPRGKAISTALAARIERAGVPLPTIKRLELSRMIGAWVLGLRA